MQHDPGLNPLGFILKEALLSDDIEEAVQRLELTRSGSDISVAKYYNIDTQAVTDIPSLYTAEDELALAYYDCDEVDLKPGPTRHPGSGWRWTPSVVEVCRLVNDQVNAVQDKSAPPAIMRIAGAPFMLFQDFQSGQIAALEWKLAFQTLIAIMKKNALCHDKVVKSVEQVEAIVGDKHHNIIEQELELLVRAFLDLAT